MKILQVFLVLISILPLCGDDIEFLEHNITSNFFQVNTVFPADINRDGLIDIVASGAAVNGEVSWWENSCGSQFIRHAVTENFDARNVMAIDINEDEYLDIIACSVWENQIRIWLNNGADLFLEEIMVDSNFTGAHTIDVKDINGDGILDVLCSGFDYYGYESEIAWWENNGVLEFTKHLISERFQTSPFIFGADINRDDQMDVLSCGEMDGEVLWWEQSEDNLFVEHMIDSTFAMAHTVFARDLDQDEDLDILGSACMNSQFAWWENNGNQEFSKHFLDSAAGALWLDAYDMDNDGDLDLLGAAQGMSSPVWYDNNGSQVFTRYQLPGSCAGGFCAIAADFDNDGDKDVCCAGWNSNKITWWESRLHHVDFEGIPRTGHAPLSVEFEDTSNMSSPILAWEWDFNGDGITDSYEQNPVWIFQEPGIYNVSLTVQTAFITVIENKEEYIEVFNGHSALEFNGYSSYALCNGNPLLNLTDEYTIEFWMKPVEWIGYFERILDKGSIYISITENFPIFNEHSLVVQMNHTDGTLSRINSGENSIQLQQWQHVAVVYNGEDEARIYLNSILQNSTVNPAPSGTVEDNSGAQITFGNSSQTSTPFRGMIDEVRIWNTQRTAQDIMNHMFLYLDGNETGLLANWRFNEGNGDIITDICGNAEEGCLCETNWVQGMELIYTAIEENKLVPGLLTAEMKSYPNPFNPAVTITYHLPRRQHVTLEIFNLKGQKVATIVNQEQMAGIHDIIWMPAKCCSGVYYSLLVTPDAVVSEKMVLIK